MGFDCAIWYLVLVLVCVINSGRILLDVVLDRVDLLRFVRIVLQLGSDAMRCGCAWIVVLVVCSALLIVLLGCVVLSSSFVLLLTRQHLPY